MELFIKLAKNVHCLQFWRILDPLVCFEYIFFKIQLHNTVRIKALKYLLPKHCISKKNWLLICVKTFSDVVLMRY
jgi:hypothetical protein